MIAHLRFVCACTLNNYIFHHLGTYESIIFEFQMPLWLSIAWTLMPCVSIEMSGWVERRIAAVC